MAKPELLEPLRIVSVPAAQVVPGAASKAHSSSVAPAFLMPHGRM
jgi:hypothetical protein